MLSTQEKLRKCKLASNFTSLIHDTMVLIICRPIVFYKAADHAQSIWYFYPKVLCIGHIKVVQSKPRFMTLKNHFALALAARGLTCQHELSHKFHEKTLNKSSYWENVIGGLLDCMDGPHIQALPSQFNLGDFAILTKELWIVNNQGHELWKREATDERSWSPTIREYFNDSNQPSVYLWVRIKRLFLKCIYH